MAMIRQRSRIGDGMLRRRKRAFPEPPISPPAPVPKRHNAAAIALKAVRKNTDKKYQRFPDRQICSCLLNKGVLMESYIHKARKNWLVGGGEMGKVIRSMDWSKTP